MRFRSSRSLNALVLAALLMAALQAQPADPAPTLHAQIDRIFKEKAYAAPQFGPARWLPDGSAYAIVEKPAGRRWFRDRSV